ncbi:MAG: hypothetical protein BBJ57_02070 [Desulfobacterales bacterium PC51MH44]|nr:MAG: hypothetical protein BBJ57_02070 [Desulfobacterales bacterium PC51MH44]
MPIAVAVSEGNRVPFTPTADVSAGVPQVLDAIVVVPTSDIAADELGSAAVEGLFEVAKPGTFATTFGQKLYYDVADGEVNEDSGNVLMGAAMSRQLSADTSVIIKLAGHGLI